uniref:LAGLIDADG endonuclease n=1 Tax=Annulohypoxylon stygium TaxID=326628 RepID=V5RG34_9PEZI|nr:LAGLIDADG endonuclease [Annulohypoxylon stygium]AHB33525.1 LAGLIDADG endonuclease [Annulohypoxylon stygium]
MSGPRSLINFCSPLQLKNKAVKKLKNFFLPSRLDNKSDDLPSHLKKIIPLASKEFLEWLVGFTDAEGNFSILPQRNWTSVGLRFTIEVHVDDIDILYKIKEKLDIGNVVITKTRSSARFYVEKFEDINSVIIPIFKQYPLQTTKYLDFANFLDAAFIKLNSSGIYNGRMLNNKFSDTDLLKLKKLKEAMNSGRLIIKSQEENFLKNKVIINKWWLLGFIEGEGTFGYKHLVPYFQIAQNQKNLFVLQAIEEYLINTLKLPKGKEVIKYSLNQGTGVYSMVIYTVDINFHYIVPFFESMTFFSRKGEDYLYWVIVVIIHKLGYFYLPDGKKIALLISSATNKFRYTTSLTKTELPSDESISKLLAQTPPFDLSSGRSHFELVREFTIAKGGRKGFSVYIYELNEQTPSAKYIELKGSPFSTYGDGHEAIGLKRGSRVIGRYIDTGKNFKNKFLFRSIPLDKE